MFHISISLENYKIIECHSCHNIANKFVVVLYDNYAGKANRLHLCVACTGDTAKKLEEIFQENE